MLKKKESDSFGIDDIMSNDHNCYITLYKVRRATSRLASGRRRLGDARHGPISCDVCHAINTKGAMNKITEKTLFLQNHN